MKGRDKATTIARVEVYEYGLTYAHGRYVMSRGRVIDSLSSIVVRVVTREGIEGFGEVCPLGPTYLPAHAAGARAALSEIVQSVIGVDVSNHSALHEIMNRALMGHAYAKSAVDVACWDAFGKAVGLPVAALLGGYLQESFPLYFAVPLDSADAMAEFVADRRAEGVRRFQLKLGADPYEDVARIRRIAQTTNADGLIVADANGGWRLQAAVIAVRALEQFDRLFVEQPCPTLEECLIVRDRTTLPIVLDESIVDVWTLLRAFNAKAMEAVNLKISKLGGLTPAALLRDLAQELGLQVTVEDTWGGDVVTAAVAHLAASTREDALFTASFMNDWTNEHIAGYEPRSVNGRGAASKAPGLGISVDLERLGRPLFAATG